MNIIKGHLRVQKHTSVHLCRSDDSQFPLILYEQSANTKTKGKKTKALDKVFVLLQVIIKCSGIFVRYR